MTTYNTGVRSRTQLAAVSGQLYGREDTEFQDGIALLETWKHPALRVLQHLGAINIATRDVHYFEDVYRGIKDQVNWSTQLANSATGIVVDNAAMWTVGDLCRHDDSNEVMLVTSVGSTFIGVVRDLGQSTESWTALATTIDDNDYLTRLSSAYMAGAPTPGIVTTLEVEKVNYSATHRTSVGVTEDVANSRLRGEQELAYQKRKKAVEHDMVMDNQFFWGKPYRGSKAAISALTSNTAPDTPFGINHYLETYGSAANLKDETELTENEFQDFLEVCAAKGANEKYLFAPRKLFGGFQKWAVTKQQMKSDDSIMGMNIQKWQWGPDFLLNLVLHDGLAANVDGTDYHYCFVLDLNEVALCHFGPDGPTKYVPLDVRHATGETSIKGEYETKYSFIIRLADHHARLRFKTIAA